LNSIVSKNPTHSSLPPLDPDFEPNIRFDDLKERPWQGGRGSLLPGNNQGTFNENSLNSLRLAAKTVRNLSNVIYINETHPFIGIYTFAETPGPLPHVCQSSPTVDVGRRK